MAKSTKIIAALGAVAGLGVAAMPLASYADNKSTVTDTISVEVTPSCEFSTGGANLANVTVSAGSLARGADFDFGENATHTFVVSCNVGSYKVTAQATDLNLQDAAEGANHKVINFVESGSYSAASKEADGKWTAQLGGTNAKAGAVIGKSASTVMEGLSTTTDTFNVTYSGYVGTAQSAGTYTGTVTYILAAPNA